MLKLPQTKFPEDPESFVKSILNLPISIRNIYVRICIIYRLLMRYLSLLSANFLNTNINVNAKGVLHKSKIVNFSRIPRHNPSNDNVTTTDKRSKRFPLNDVLSKNITLLLENLLKNYESSQLPTHGQGNV